MNSPDADVVVTTQDVLREPWSADQCDTAAEAGRRLAPDSPDPAVIADAARRAGHVLAAWDGYGYVYPRWQWTADGRRPPLLDALLAVLPRERDGTLGADAVLWAWSPDAALDGLTPAALFATDPDRVIALARRRRGAPDDAD